MLILMFLIFYLHKLIGSVFHITNEDYDFSVSIVKYQIECLNKSEKVELFHSWVLFENLVHVSSMYLQILWNRNTFGSWGRKHSRCLKAKKHYR